MATCYLMMGSQHRERTASQTVTKTNTRRKSNVHTHGKKAWYEVYHVEIKDGIQVMVTETVETWFPERWEKKHTKTPFIKKQEVTYKVAIPEEKLIEYAFEHNMIKEEANND